MDETQCSGDEGKQSLGIVRGAGEGRYDKFAILVDVFHKEGMEWTNTKGSRDIKFLLQRHTQCIL